jgi:acetyl-CoA synthetase
MPGRKGATSGGTTWSPPPPTRPAVECGAETRCSSSTRPARRAAEGAAAHLGGYLTYAAYTTRSVFDLREDDVYACVADVGWITGPQLHRVRPARQRRDHADVRVDADLPRRRGATGTWSSATASPSSTRRRRRCGAGGVQGDRFVKPRPLEPAGARHRGRADQPRRLALVPRRGRRGRCTVVDTWWQTETGGIAISPIAPVTADQAGLGHDAAARGSCRC